MEVLQRIGRQTKQETGASMSCGDRLLAGSQNCPFSGSFMIRTARPWVNHSVWVPSYNCWLIWAARCSWSLVSFKPTGVQFFITDTLSCMSAIVMFTGSFSGRWLWLFLSGSITTEHGCYVMPFSPICQSSSVQSHPRVNMSSSYYQSTGNTLWMVQWWTSCWLPAWRGTLETSWPWLSKPKRVSRVPLQAGSQGHEPLFGSLQCPNCGQFTLLLWCFGGPALLKLWLG